MIPDNILLEISNKRMTTVDAFIVGYEYRKKSLPDYTELKILILRFIAGKDCPYTHFKSRIVDAEELTELAKIIAKRIGKEAGDEETRKNKG